MRVVATEDFKTYYQMVCVDVEAGEEFDGPFAEFLHNGGCPVDVLDGEDIGQAATGGGDGNGDEPPTTGTGDAAPPPEGGSGQPTEPGLDITDTAAEVLEWVSGDPQRALEALEAEQAKDKPRSTLVKKLEEIAGA